MFDAGAAAYEAALDQDLDALIALNEQVYMSCVVCHRRTRPDYGRSYKRFDERATEEPRVPSPLPYGPPAPDGLETAATITASFSGGPM